MDPPHLRRRSRYHRWDDCPGEPRPLRRQRHRQRDQARDSVASGSRYSESQFEALVLDPLRNRRPRTESFDIRQHQRGLEGRHSDPAFRQCRDVGGNHRDQQPRKGIRASGGGTLSRQVHRQHGRDSRRGYCRIVAPASHPGSAAAERVDVSGNPRRLSRVRRDPHRPVPGGELPWRRGAASRFAHLQGVSHPEYRVPRHRRQAEV